MTRTSDTVETERFAVKRVLALIFCAALIAGCTSSGSPGLNMNGSGATPTPGPVANGMVSLIDLGTGQYLGAFEGGLYPGGSNSVPAAHDAAGKAKAALVQPLDASGNPSVSGKIVMMSIGMSNTTDEWCDGPTGMLSCMTWTFTRLALATSGINSNLVIANGALGGQDAKQWLDPTACLASPIQNYCNNYDRIAGTNCVSSCAAGVLPTLGVTEKQVQAIWLKEADAGPTVSLPSASADAYKLETYLGDIVRAAKVRYPNLQLVFLSSRIYAGYATTALNPEPYAYESGFAVKWLIAAQINQADNGGTIDPIAGDLSYATAPWVGWAAYLWANGTTANGNGTIWCNGQASAPCNGEQDFQSDGTHPSAAAGQQKVGTLLLNFFKSSPYATPWFL